LLGSWVAIAAGYLLGSIPFALLLTRGRGIDLRASGSGNIGAANVLRTSGVRAAALVMVLDGLKGAFAVVLAERLTGDVTISVTAGVASILGHVYPVWLRFHGGKGVATAAGVFTVLAPIAVGVATGVFLLAVWLTRYVSLGSVAAAISLIIVVIAREMPYEITAGAVFSAAVILYRHRTNFVRIRAGTEWRVGQRVSERL
jgi:glycerol-3-phosphate acyltransferase PlsY